LKKGRSLANIILNLANTTSRIQTYLRFSPFEVGTPEGRAKERNRRVLLTSLATVLAKIIAVVTLITTTPPILHYLGHERFGLWMTISSWIVMLGFVDLGIGNGLQNFISNAHGSDDRELAHRAVTSSFVLLALVGILLVLSLSVAHFFLDWGLIFNVSDPSVAYEAGVATVALIVCLAINLPLLTAQKVQLGYQDGFQANLWLAGGSIFMLLSIFTAIYLNAGLPWLVLAVAGGPAVVMGLNWLHQFLVVRRWLIPHINYFDWKMGRHIAAMGAVWTWFQLMAFIGTSADNIIISHLFGASAVGSYAIMAKLQSILLIAQMLSAPLWPAFAEALVRGDLDWARRTFTNAMVLFTGLGIVSALVMGIGSFWIVRVWVGPEMVPTTLMAIGFASWGLITNFFAAIAALMANNRLISKFAVLTTVAAILSLILKFIFAKEIGVPGVIWASVIGYGLICVPGLLAARMALK